MRERVLSNTGSDCRACQKTTDRLVLDRIVGSSDPEVFVDQVSTLPTAKKPVLLLGLLFLLTDSAFEVRIMDDSVQC